MSVWTVSVEGGEQEDGERGYLYVVDAVGRDDASELALLYHNCDREDSAAKATDCYRGMPKGDDAEDAYNDLRSNTVRGRRAAGVLEKYPDHDGDDIDTKACDLIADLLHLVVQQGGNVDGTMRRATDHFRCEAKGEG
jgi:hypothetical protein